MVPTRPSGVMGRRISELSTTVVWWVWRLLVDDRQVAEDVVQEAFAALYRHWGRFVTRTPPWPT